MLRVHPEASSRCCWPSRAFSDAAWRGYCRRVPAHCIVNSGELRQRVAAPLRSTSADRGMVGLRPQRGMRVRFRHSLHTRPVSDDLPIPSALASLIEVDAWPTIESANSQNSRPLATPAAIDRLAPGERSLFLNPPPFSTLASEIAANPGFWGEHGALTEIDPDLALVIGDFGSGSDTAIVLDYRRSPNEPSVMRLAWTSQGNHWVEAAPSFEAFAQALQLD